MLYALCRKDDYALRHRERMYPISFFREERGNDVHFLARAREDDYA